MYGDNIGFDTLHEHINDMIGYTANIANLLGVSDQYLATDNSESETKDNKPEQSTLSNEEVEDKETNKFHLNQLDLCINTLEQIKALDDLLIVSTEGGNHLFYDNTLENIGKLIIDRIKPTMDEINPEEELIAAGG